jgi:hypothetical protein
MVTLPATEPSADEGSETWVVKSRYLLPERALYRARALHEVSHAQPYLESVHYACTAPHWRIRAFLWAYPPSCNECVVGKA